MIYGDETGLDIVFGTRDIGLTTWTFGNGNEKYHSLGFHQLSQGYDEDTKMETIQKEEGFATRPLVELVFPANDPKGLDTVLKMLNAMRKENYPYYAVVFAEKDYYPEKKLHAGFSLSSTLKQAKKNLERVEENWEGVEFKIVKLHLNSSDVEDTYDDGKFLYLKEEQTYEDLESV